jgi:GTP-binding protein
VALTKVDALAPDVLRAQVQRLERAMHGTPPGKQAAPSVISAVTGAGVEEVLRALLRGIETVRTAAPERAARAPAWQP